MSTPDDLTEGPERDAEGEGRDPASSRPYDPLFDTWDEPPEPPERGYGDAFGDVTAPRADISFEQDDIFWSVPASSVLKPERTMPGADVRYPDRYQPTYHERLTELQRRLREQTVTVPAPERRWLVTVRELAETLLLALLIFLAVRASFQNFRVDGASMQPSLQNGEYLIVNKLSYATVDLSPLSWLPFVSADGSRELWGSPQRGDIVVFRAPTDTDRDFIKRIIGIPGDTVEIDADTGTVRVNGEILSEPYIQGRTTCQGRCVFVLPERDTRDSRAECGSDACYFVMGDNRQNSSDSRQGWFVPQENIIGKALITYWHDGSPAFDLAPNHSVDFIDDAAASRE